MCEVWSDLDDVRKLWLENDFFADESYEMQLTMMYAILLSWFTALFLVDVYI